MQIALITLAVCAVVLVPVLLFLLILHPIWAIVEVCGSALLGRGRRIVWLLMLLVLATVASVPYAIFATASGVLRKLTIACLLLLSLSAAAGYAVVRYQPRLKDEILVAGREAIARDATYGEVLGYAKHLGLDKAPWASQLLRLIGD